MATNEGTWDYRDRFGDRYGRTYFRRFGPGVVSSIGVGTYLGDPTDAVDERYHDAIVTALENGCNMLDTAVNYRCGRSEHVVGEALADADIGRDAVVVATKGGFLPFDRRQPEDPAQYVREEFIEMGLVDPADLARGSHCIAPEFLDTMLDRSRAALAVETVDCYYVHNPETQLAENSREAVYDQLQAAFEQLERAIDGGRIGRYGVASWDAFRLPPDHEKHLALSEVVTRAEAAAAAVGRDPGEHGLAALQLPFNVHMADAFTATHHENRATGEAISTLRFAEQEGLSVVASASILQGGLVEGLPSEISAELEGDSPVQRAINFARSAPAVTTALVGMSSPEHVRENLAAGTFDPLGAAAFDAVFE
ncbi:aldo/keto reductase [Halolamina sp.]|uniref:aldo/keto reductase n=1 Tax=Halolamina sp. TaxID=1940283 RepID=UPI000223B48D|nr:aldo/keto reductase [halophilic archaeon DL31]